MKLTTALLLFTALHVCARTTGQIVSYSGRNVRLEEVFSALEKQTGYGFFYHVSDLKNTRPVTIEIKNIELQEALGIILKNQALSFLIDGKTVFITPGKNTILQAPVANAGLIIPPLLDVKGKVRDENGEPVAGVSILIKGTTRGTSTNNDGEFLLKDVEENAVLVFSSVNHQSFEVKVTPGNSADLVVTLKQKINELSELAITAINTGYQRIRPEQSTGAVARISTKEYESRISTNFADGLTNRLPGLLINNDVSFTSSAPGVGSRTRNLFNIRGISTMSANQNPLIVVDGYPTELTLDMIDPNEIKSVTILKDAAAATVYGVRASNGVIVIERKQADQGKPRFTFRATTGITPRENYSRYRWEDSASAVVLTYQKTLYSKSVNADTWDQAAVGAGGKNGFPQVYYILAQQAARIITPEQAARAYANLLNYDNIDDYSRLFQRNAVTQAYNLNVSGGNSNALYYITANYTKNNLSQVENDNNRILLSGRSLLKFSRKLSLELTTDYQEQRYNSAPIPGVSSLSPYERFQDENGDPTFVTSGSSISPYYNTVLMSSFGLEDNMYYPMVDLNEISSKTHTVNNRITAKFNYTIGGGFDLTFGGIYETSRSDYEHYASGVSSEARQYINSYASQDPATGKITFNIPKGGYLSQQTSNTSSYTLRTQLNYNKSIATDHSINAIVGAEIRDLIDKTSVTSTFGYNDQTLIQQPVDWAGINAGTIKNSFQLTYPFVNSVNNLFDQNYSEDRFISGYANVVYSFRNTYSLTGSARIDQSNLFGTDPRYKYKPLWSVGAAWNINKERFMQGIDWLRQLKLRAAYGFNGNVAKESLPQVIASYILSTYTSPSTTALTKYSYANNSLRWEQTQNLNFGLDFSIFKNVYGSVDYYTKRSTDVLGNAQIDPTIGTSPSVINQATINNQGVELDLHADWISTTRFNWNMGLVLARNTSKVLDVFQTIDYNPQNLNSLGYVKGYPVGALFAYRYAGLDTAGYPLISNGRGRLYPTNISTTTNPTSIAIKSDTSGLTRYMGSSIPTINVGLSNRVDIGSFYIFCMINYYGGFKVFVPRPNPSATRPQEGAGTYWKAKGDELTTDVMALAGYTNTNSNYVYNYSDAYVVNGDYITLADVTVSYSLDKYAFVKKAGFSHFEVKCQASNLWTVGLNKYNYSRATGTYQKSYITPTYTIGVFTNF
jgi:TonB-linked SusC/RagA family outer membrane protein